MNEAQKPTPSPLAQAKASLREINGRTRGPYHNEHWAIMETLAHALHLISAQNNPQHYAELEAECDAADALAVEKRAYATQQRVVNPKNADVFEAEADAAEAYAKDLRAQISAPGK